MIPKEIHLFVDEEDRLTAPPAKNRKKLYRRERELPELEDFIAKHV